MELVFVETPYSQYEADLLFAQECLHDSMSRGEVPFSTHVMYAGRGDLDDPTLDQRALLGRVWGRMCSTSVFYLDRGLTASMIDGLKDAVRHGRLIQLRKLYAEISAEEIAQVTEIVDAAPDRIAPRPNSVSSVLTEVCDELLAAEAKWGAFASRHEAYAVLLEEVDEMWDEIKANQSSRAREEAVQVAAMALRYLRDF